MQTRLIKIGNSQGVRLPKTVIEQANLADELELEVSGNAVIISSVHNPRSGWAESAATCHEAGDDLLDDWDTTLGDFEGSWE